MASSLCYEVGLSRCVRAAVESVSAFEVVGSEVGSMSDC